MTDSVRSTRGSRREPGRSALKRLRPDSAYRLDTQLLDAPLLKSTRGRPRAELLVTDDEPSGLLRQSLRAASSIDRFIGISVADYFLLRIVTTRAALTRSASQPAGRHQIERSRRKLVIPLHRSRRQTRGHRSEIARNLREHDQLLDLVFIRQ